MQRINNDYIKSIYNIDTMRKTILVKQNVGMIDLQDIIPCSNSKSSFNKTDLLTAISTKLEEFSEEVSFSIEPYGYDGGFDINVTQEVEQEETDREVLERLKTIERIKRKENKKIQEAKELLGIQD